MTEARSLRLPSNSDDDLSNRPIWLLDRPSVEHQSFGLDNGRTQAPWSIAILCFEDRRIRGDGRDLVNDSE